MKQITILSLILFIWSCNNQSKNDNNVENESKNQNINSIFEDNNWNYKEVKRNYIDSLILNICSTKDVEFIDLYPVLDSIASDKSEKLFIVNLLNLKVSK